MKCLVRFRAVYSIANLLPVHVTNLQTSSFSLVTRSSRNPNRKNTEETQIKNGKENKDFANLFDDITQILGTHNFNVDSNGAERFPLTNAGVDMVGDSLDCTEGVRENANMNRELEIRTTHTVEKDVSPIVHEVTQILRGGEGEASIEERLDDMDVEFDSEVVDKVLKRCFKVPDLALRFFNWIKLKNESFVTTATYNTMIYVLGESKKFEVVEKLLDEMEKNLCKKDIKTWTILISHYGKSNAIGKVLLLFENMKKSGFEPDLAVYKVMLRTLCSSKKTSIAMEFYKEMVSKEMEPDSSLYKLLLHCLACSGDIDAIHVIADDMIRISQIPEQEVYTSMLKSFCISGRIKEALEVIKDMKNKDIVIETEHFEMLVKGMCHADRISDALEIVDILKRRDIVDKKMYGIVINGYLRRNNVSKALQVFHSLKDCGQIMTLSTYTELMQHLFRTSEFEKGFDLYNTMLETGLELDSVAITAVVAGYVQQNRISEAWEVLKSMEEKGMKLTRKCYMVFIKELCKISRADEAINVLDHMKVLKLDIGEDIFNWIISHLGKKGELEKIQQVKQIQRDGGNQNETTLDSSLILIEPKVVDSLETNMPVKSFTDHDLQRACKIVSSAIDWCSKEESLQRCNLYITPELVVEILRNCSPHGGAALQFFSWVGKKDGYSHTAETYNMAIKISGQGKDFKLMRSLFYEMRRKGLLVSSDTWTIMILQYGRIGLTDIALKFFREMKENGCSPNSSTYKSLIISLCGKKGRKVNEAIEAFLEMTQAGFVPDKELLEFYIGCLCEVDNVLEAKKCAKNLYAHGFSTPLAYSLCIRALCRAGKVEEALSMANEVGEEDQKTLNGYIYGSLIHGLLRKRRLQEALEKIESMKQVRFLPTVHVYTSLLVYFFKEKQVSKALEVFEKMKQEGCEPTIVTYSSLIRGYVSNGKTVEAWSVFHKMKNEGPLPDFKTYSMFISCLCKEGKSEEAMQLLSEMPSVGITPSTVNFRQVFYGLNREGKQKLAQTVLGKKWDLEHRRKVGQIM
ncbi:putative pentatricopeptide repeat-containing protein At5g06400, mitochondrial [Cynara cardunculus var. scolymus]|uniref:Pentatricopeptide repeat-containing protein n=1 Tax=Cynara cardunculus var. scolymus TaxID=59895 RepID=A0A103YI09_CYNCS|nr:putative pentatricopeptide repeat-containing protein At5g06400, mitochondrial [Cynara cardunculus var. scolymus]KVI09427.1 Pentatricopeptide repeat-containing protein [Cynara cardunculus var. scolymus]